MDAISYVDDIATIDLNLCIGCGLCVTTCPEDALSLKQKTEDTLSVPPADGNELYMKIGTERQQK
jgi:Fe-S-cluster-containing hydrogenase component 2